MGIDSCYLFEFNNATNYTGARTECLSVRNSTARLTALETWAEMYKLANITLGVALQKGIDDQIYSAYFM